MWSHISCGYIYQGQTVYIYLFKFGIYDYKVKVKITLFGLCEWL